MPNKPDADPIYGEYEGLGEAKVQANINARIWNKTNMITAKAWLAKIARERSDSLTREQIDVARDVEGHSRRSADAAERSAKEAKAANTMATIALVIAGVSILLVVGDLLFW